MDDFSICLDNISKISNIIIGGLTVTLAFYVFVFQKEKDKKDRKIQWLKDLVIEPNLSKVTEFYNELHKLKEKIDTDSLDNETKQELIEKVKESASNFRKIFLNLIESMAPTLHKNIFDNIDQLSDLLTETISNDELKLTNKKTYERVIESPINSSYSEVLAYIFEYEGN
ncbi:hypothetical protein HXZ88_17655 [Myroides odoratimimus]|uniref:hypothetical protein n=1 Tax=Myroides odoratimimus TaxID=76832 RepID=UPI002577D48A|nr:hypothetical protein [Myroides odoratimimus]MDM1067408.1 hypothetical protein [Myroides odoratimimus]